MERHKFQNQHVPAHSKDCKKHKMLESINYEQQNGQGFIKCKASKEGKVEEDPLVWIATIQQQTLNTDSLHIINAINLGLCSFGGQR